MEERLKNQLPLLVLSFLRNYFGVVFWMIDKD